MTSQDQAQFFALMDQAHLASEGDAIALPPYQQLITPGPDGSATTLAGFDRVGVMRAAAALDLWPPASEGQIVVHGVVDQDWSDRGIGRALMAWSEGRGRQILARLPGDGPASLLAYVPEVAAHRRRLLMAAGFSPQDHYYRMRRDLLAPIQPAQLPNGLLWCGMDQVDRYEVMAAANRTVIAGWLTPGPMYQALWDQLWQAYHREWSQVVVDSSTGQVVGFALTLLCLHEWAGQKREEALIHRFGLIDEFQGRGIGSAMLAWTLQAIAATGQRFAMSLVNPGADPVGMKINQDFGFSPAGRVIVYGLAL
ncbi:MAG: GNAT family N-acetyltransferase [Micrococcales bacterium]|nr:GNAT family N-acetyltransferase [Micrococcales bacterium]